MPAQAGRRFAALFVAASAVALAGCHVDLSMRAEAKDQWKRHYTIAKGGTLEVRNTNGLIRIEPGEGDAIDITADRVVQAANDQAAKDALAGLEIRETATADRVVIDSANRGGINIGFNMSRRVDYVVRAPAWINVKLTTTNGDITVGPGLSGTFYAEGTNGRISAQGLENSASASTTNGTISLDLAKLGEDGVTAETTNGTISVSVPPTIGARLSARVTNGVIRQEGLTLKVSEQSRRRLDATLGSGGPEIKLETTNGAITIKAR